MSGRREEGDLLGAKTWASPAGMLASTVGASVCIWAAAASKTAPFIIEYEAGVLLLPCGSHREFPTR